MKARHLAALLLALFCACYPPPRTPLVVTTASLETVALVQEIKDGIHRYCAGVWVSETDILTAGHCVAELGMDDITKAIHELVPELEIWSPVGQSARWQAKEDPSIRDAVVVRFNAHNDLALLRTKDPPLHMVATVRSSALHQGEEVHVIGHPLGDLAWSYIHGYVSHPVREMEGAGLRLELDIQIHHGNSGGGAFDRNGQLVGICSFMIRDENGLGYFVGQGLIHKFLGA